MMETIKPDKHVSIKSWAPWDEVEESAKEQIRNVSNLRVVWPWVVVLPDVHAGLGSCIGTVIPTRGALVPSASGCDLGCGLYAVRTNLTKIDFNGVSLANVRHEIENAIPHGVGKGYSFPADEFLGRYGHWFEEGFGGLYAQLDSNMEDRAARQFGTLGSGNHFIELSEDDEGSVWIVLHSGSRALGLKVAQYHIAVAKDVCKDKDLPDPNLAYLSEGTGEFDGYLADMQFAKEYAFVNRRVMMSRALEVLGRFFSVGRTDKVHCVHNYAAEETHLGQRLFVTRKGAISASVGEAAVIPGSMNDPTYIVTGLSNKESMKSAPHGAGRIMSRGKAKRTFSLADVELQTEGVECRRDAGVRDELPGAYKRVDDVIELSKTLVKVDRTLKQFVCIKG